MNIKLIFDNTVSNFIFKFFTIVAGLISLPILISNLGSTLFGAIVLLTAINQYMFVFTSGMPTGVVKFVSEYREKNYINVTHIAFIFYMVIGILASVVLLAIYWFDFISIFNIDHNAYATTQNLLLISAGLSLLLYPLNTFDQTMKGLELFVRNNIYDSIGIILSILLAIYFAIVYKSTELVFAAQSSDLIFSGFLKFSYLLKKIGPKKFFRFKADIQLFKKIFSFNFYMLLNQISGIFVNETDKLIISYFLPLKYLTIYHVISKPVNYMKQFIQLFSLAIMPSVSFSQAQKKYDIIRKNLLEFTKYANILISFFAIIGIYMAIPFLNLWFDFEFEEFTYLCQYLFFIQLIMQANNIGSAFLVGIGKIKYLTLFSVLSSIINLVVGIILTQKYGIPGVLTATLIHSVFMFVVFMFLIPYITPTGIYLRRIIRGQAFNWIVGLSFLPLYSYYAAIGSWVILVAAAGVLALVMIALNYFFNVDRKFLRSLIFR